MALIFPGDRLMPRMSADALTALGSDLRDVGRDLQAEHAPLFRALATWWKWYEAVPRQKEKTFPFVGASNVVVPLIGITCDALASRSLAQATAAAPTYWSCLSQNEDPARQRTASRIQTLINWQAGGNEFSLEHVLADQFLEAHVAGRGAVAINFRHDVRPVFFQRGGGPAKRAQITFHRGPAVEHIPNEHLLWDRRFRVGDAPVVVRRHEWTWAQIRDMAKLDDAWDAEAVREVKRFPGVEGGTEGELVTSTKADLDLRDTDGQLARQLHEVWEIWVDWSVLGNRFEVPGEEEWGGTQVPLLAHLHVQSGRILRLVGSPYTLPYKPFVDFRFRAGRGVAKRLEMIQQIETTVVNQELDAGTRRNALWGKTRNAALQRLPLDPSKLMLVGAMDEFEAIAHPNYTQSNLALLVAANTMAERWMGASDPLMGRDTRSGGHPAPATSTLALLEQVNVMSAGTDVVIRQELSRMGEALAILNQQFESNEGGWLQRVFGAADAAAMEGYLFPDEPLPGNYAFDVKALDRNQNPETQMRQALQVAQVYQNFCALVAQGAMILDSPQGTPRVKAVWAKLTSGMNDLLERFLDAANVDDSERFLLELKTLGIDARGILADATAGAGGPQAAAGAGAPGAAGGPGGVAASGSLVSPVNGAGGGAGSPFTGGGVLQ